MNLQTRTLIPLLFVLLFAGAGAISTKAEAAAQMPVMPPPICYNLNNTIHFGQQDANSHADVDSLQRFLSSQGDFDSSLFGSGHFGPVTLKAVKKFQAVHAIPTTGFVGPLTLAAIAKEQPDCVPSANAASLYSLSPESGPIGTKISIKGYGFSSSNTILIDGMVAERNVPIASSIAIACTTDPSCHGGINQTITFILPDSVGPDCPVGSMCPLYLRMLEPGKVTIMVRNSSAVSKGLPFTITK